MNIAASFSEPKFKGAAVVHPMTLSRPPMALTKKWAPGHALRKPNPRLGQNSWVDWPVISLVGDGLAALGSVYLVTKTDGILNTVSWIVLTLSAVRVFNDVAQIMKPKKPAEVPAEVPAEATP